MRTTALTESTVRRRAKRKGLLLQKGRSHPPYRKPFRVVDGTTGAIRFGTERYGQSLAECANFLRFALPSCEDIKARLRRLDARKAAFKAKRRGIKNVRAHKIWKGINFAPVGASNLFETCGTALMTYDLSAVWRDGVSFRKRL